MEFITLMHIGLPDTIEQKHLNFKYARYRTAAILKNRKGAIYLQWIDPFCQNLGW